MRTWKIVCIALIIINTFLLGLWLTGHLKYERYAGIGPLRTARLVHGEPMDVLPDYSQRMAGMVIRAYDGFVRRHTGNDVPIDEAYETFFAFALTGYDQEDWDLKRLIPDSVHFDNVARILFREPGDLLPIASLDYVSPAMLSASYGADEDDPFGYSGWHLGTTGDRNHLFFRSLMSSNREWAYLVDRALALGDFLPPGFLRALHDHPEYFNFADEATRLYISLAFLDRYIQYNPDFRLEI